MNVWKKIGALVVVVVLAMGLCVMANATAVTMDDDGILGTTAGDLNETLNIPVKLKVFNPSQTSVYAPNITYTFEVTAGAAGETITDTADPAVTVKTKSPSGEGQLPTLGDGTTQSTTTTTTLSWSSADTKVTAASGGNNTGENNVQNLTLTFDKSKFSASGVYRFKITETTAYSTSGVTAGTVGKTDDNTHVLYLDVYFRDVTGAADTIYAYVLHTGTAAAGNKVEGFEDEYHTSNLKISQKVTHDDANLSTLFPMSVTFDKGDVTNGFHLLTGKEGGTTTVLDKIADKTYTDTTASVFSNEGDEKTSYVEYYGIPTGVKFTVVEKNPVDGTTYGVTYKVDGGAASSSESTYSGGKVTAGPTTVLADTPHTVEFTNDLSLISPTGVVLRYAPYALMLGAGITVLPLSRSHKKREEDF